MVAPFPQEARSKEMSPSQRAKNIYNNYGWLARFSEEITNEPEIDLKKLAQLAIGERSQCALFAAEIPEDLKPESPLARAVEARFYVDGIEWASREAQVADLLGIRTAAVALRAYAEANMPESKSMARVEMTDMGVVEVPIKVSKADKDALLGYVKALREEFED